jgi:Ca-activated chloride channel homolog
VKRILCGLLLTLLLMVPTVSGESNLLIRKRVSEVRLTLVATDSNNRPIARLSPDDIMVLEDGRPIPRFELRSATDLPLRLGVVLDLSDSTRKSWDAVRRALVQSLQPLMRPNDELLVLTFGSRIELDSTVANPEQLAAVLDNPPAGGLTALYDTLYTVCGRAEFADNRVPHRSALIVVSDGEDDLSLHGLPDAIAKAQRSAVSIYTVASHNSKKRSQGDQVLHDLATTTGGRDFIVKNAAQFAEALASINEELRGGYLLYYRVPDGNGPFRRVRIVPVQSIGTRMRSRDGYYTAP